MVSAVTRPQLHDFQPYAGPIDAPVAPAKPRTQTLPAQPIPEPLWHVILLNDDLHSVEYVIEMLSSIFGYDVKKGYSMAREVHENGRVIVATVHKELAELRLEQILDYGPDPGIPECPGSMNAEIEPAA
ncbi:MAG: ATP-dependent Clp protease adaptor protein ClpS [Verrucomicrobiaceae bacterium]|nr:ATP-dependent Clp protease adaptor protein ClpS [Verrucomicrobiaceae bacterium]